MNDAPNLIQGPHCLIDIKIKNDLKLNTDDFLNLVDELKTKLNMKALGSPRVIRGENGKISIYQIISTSHIIIHCSDTNIYADLFSCEPFDFDECVSVLTNQFGNNFVIQYCQRNLTNINNDEPTIKMIKLNKLTSNESTFTHALINWYGGDSALLGSIEKGTNILKKSLVYLDGTENLPPSNILLVDVDPIPGTWDKGGFSGGYINLMRQLTMHTFIGLNGAYTDIMGYTFDLEKIIEIIKTGFNFKFYEIDGIFQRQVNLSTK